MKRRRYISFILFTCFSVFLGHNLVPHHHHAGVINRAINEKCPVGHEDHHDAENPPLHCHAFNSVDFVKHGHSEIEEPVRQITVLTVPISSDDLKQQASLEFRKILRLKIPVKNDPCLGAVSLRAPPVAA